MDAADLAVLLTDPWFGDLPTERRALLLDHAQIRLMSDGGRIYGFGDAPNGLWAVLEGQVRLKAYPAPGVEFVALVLRSGAWFGEVSTLDGASRPHDATASGTARVLHLPMSTFHRLAETTPALYLDLGRLVCRHQRVALDFIAQTVALPFRVRLARLLEGRTRDAGGVLSLRQEDLAVMLSVSRQTLNGGLRAMARAGLIRQAYGRVEIIDRARLAAMASAADC
jgi:CRP-like cAMP-binding protein